ncbi:nicotine blue oxidoreductase [Arthrobacter stackebrandtii]|uniref:Nicotine blue oxidoreductase n=1 Tax=Arthrobacter stackebrandtii TaxID=272161 RepID=A0ABS4Z158_9MICC|nr:nucleotidyltransferase family protein [Arthrobacter stackebrandtii]MBP2414782.1 nicotine blue oxidoreductase [Arthrobacter stackebrandtii]PYG99444.1 molybdenum cofactor cytidylyltransferase [Arthrobacter stackebrandtii]
MTRTTAVLLAAGAGTRLGLGPKALLPFRGTTLVAHAAGELLRGGCTEVVVVTGAGAGEVAAVPLPPGCRVVVNPRWQDGMGSSFAVGVAAALDGQGHLPPADGTVLVALVDQPGMDAALISTLIALHRPGRITAAGYRSGHGVPAGPSGTSGSRPPLRRGNPVVFTLAHAAGAAAMASGDSAARAYLKAHADVVDLVDFSPFTDGADVDTPADLHLLQ